MQTAIESISVLYSLFISYGDYKGPGAYAPYSGYGAYKREAQPEAAQ